MSTNQEERQEAGASGESSRRIEQLESALRKAERLLARTPKATRSMYVSRDAEPWGVQAADVLESIRAALAEGAERA